MKYSVKISNLSFDLEFQPIWEVEPPVFPEHPVVTPKPPIITEVFDLDAYLKGKEGVVRLPESMDNKEVVIRSKGWIKPEKVTALIGRKSILSFENWDDTPEQLIDNAGCKEFGIAGITFVCPPNRPIKTACPPKAIFGWMPDSVDYGKFAYIAGQEIKDKERMTFGLSRFVYSSNNEKRIYLIAKNIWHNGYVFTEAKNNYTGNLWQVYQNVTVKNPIEVDTDGPNSAPSSMFYCPTRIPVRISVKDGVAKIISDNTFDQILTWAGYNNGNQRSILYFDKFVYDISEYKLIDNKTLNLAYADEFQCGDVIDGLGEVIQKQINESRQSNWIYSFAPTDKPNSFQSPIGTFDAYIVYKGNALFSNGHLNKNTQFPEGEVLSSQGYGWTVYDHFNSGYYENVRMQGYMRLSDNGGINEGLTIRDSWFEKNPPIATENKDMPKEASDYIEYLENLL